MVHPTAGVSVKLVSEVGIGTVACGVDTAVIGPRKKPCPCAPQAGGRENGDGGGRYERQAEQQQRQA
eukprot:7384915-Prorocentrum_lima.AAC.1